MIFKVLYYLFLLIPNNLKQLLLEDESGLIQLRIKKFIEGYDERKHSIHNKLGYDNTYVNADDNDDYNEENNNSMLFRIKNHILHKEILEILENPNIHLNYKLELIEKHRILPIGNNIININNHNEISSFNLLAGNLYKDFYE